MSVRTVTLFFALLTLASLGAVGVTAALRLLAPFSQGAVRARERIAEEIGGQGLALAAVVATVAFAGSLYLSEIAGFRPCTLCWVQRGFMYPLAPLLAVAAWRGWHVVRRPARLAALAGGAVALWHVLVERLPALQGTTVCDVGSPCWLRWVEHFGFVTIPVMSLAAFALVTTLLSRPLSAPAAHDDRDDHEPELVP
jgi:disulfide bond formation protein DsbB